ncbi:hypothetical protein B0186_06495 [Canicola haemoglobinophilus]|uniref:Uncharacterized protein n=1 Tax=Canicola haemoglobinophilus TaxID=733 RepID=A0A1V4B0I0_9PAST|nr:hypothetical protein [Canicola haemoglobinophilus]OOS00012.1 hypothetical protein B0186_06495 [Canicola haemoglobinophilus]STO60901.1 Uncharacterised protein [Canicola haemoglobinophilus]
MKKIYKLKKWLTLEETAERLSIELNEKVTKADVLQLGVDEELKISICIPIDLTAKKCEFVKREECTYFNIGADFIFQMGGLVNKIKEKLNLDNMLDDILKERLDKIGFLNEEPLRDGRFMRISSNETRLLSGVYELELIGNELLDIQWELSEEKKLPKADVIKLCGFYVKDKNGDTFEIQSKIDIDEHIKLQKEIKSDLKQATAQSDLSYIKKTNVVEKINSLQFHKKVLTYPCPSISEIEGAFFVVQTEHLNEFLSSLDDDNQNNLTLDNSLYLLGEVLNAVKSKAKKWTQGDLINEILLHRQNQNKTAHSLEQRKIEEYFSKANKKTKI